MLVIGRIRGESNRNICEVSVLLQMLATPIRGENDMENSATTFIKMENSIRAKLLKAKAVSREEAVTIQEARFDMQEQNWLAYVAGGLFADVKKTTERRYYITLTKPT
jgi:hypothetical protein